MKKHGYKDVMGTYDVDDEMKKQEKLLNMKK